MHALARRVATALRFDRLAGPGDCVLVALSGGPDSVALTLLLAEALPAVGAVLAGAAHLHHGLRGGEADSDESFCRAFAAGLALPLVVDRCDAAALAREQRISIETAGHRARLAFFERAARELGATRVATGHTENDLAETFLMRALRGAGLRGLGGIRPSRDSIIRPLLAVSRAELLSYLADRGQVYCEDATNLDRRIPRNRIRHEVLPWLEQHEGGQVVGALARAARLAASDEALLEEATRRATRSAPWNVLSDGLSIDAAALRRLPRPLQNRVVLRGIERVSGRTGSVTSVDRVVQMLDAEGGARAFLSGLEARVDRGTLVLTPAARNRDRRAPEGRPWFPVTPAVGLPVPGEARLGGGGRIEVARQPCFEGRASFEPAGRPAVPGTQQATLDADRCRLPLAVRFRRPGDRLEPLGLGGHKKLQDLLVDRKIPREERDRLPLVVDASDQILWVPGHAVADAARVTPATTSVLLLQYWR